jgi:hypothetical protein
MPRQPNGKLGTGENRQTSNGRGWVNKVRTEHCHEKAIKRNAQVQLTNLQAMYERGKGNLRPAEASWKLE